MKKLTIYVCLNLAILCLCVCPGLADNKPNTIRIGVIQSLTGFAAINGKTNLEALQMAAEEINQRSKNAVELIIEDDQTDPKQAVTAWHKLTRDSIDAVIGSSWDYTTVPLVALSGQRKMVLITGGAPAESLPMHQGQGFATATAFSSDTDQFPIAAWLMDKKPKSLALIAAENPWGIRTANAFREGAKTAGVPVVEQINLPNLDNNNIESILPRIKKHNPGAIAFVINATDVETFLKRAREQRISIPMYGAISAVDAFNMTTRKDLFEDVCMSYPYLADARGSNFIEKFKSRTGTEPPLWAFNHYDTLHLIYEAIGKARQTGKPLKDVIRQGSWDLDGGHYQFNAEDRSMWSGRPGLACVEGAQLRRHDQSKMAG